MQEGRHRKQQTWRGKYVDHSSMQDPFIVSWVVGGGKLSLIHISEPTRPY